MKSIFAIIGVLLSVNCIGDEGRVSREMPKKHHRVGGPSAVIVYVQKLYEDGYYWSVDGEQLVDADDYASKFAKCTSGLNFEEFSFNSLHKEIRPCLESFGYKLVVASE